MMIGFVLILIVLIGAAAYGFGWQPQFNQNRPAQTGQTPAEILKARYARGEISRDEYEQTHRDLEG